MKTRFLLLAAMAPAVVVASLDFRARPGEKPLLLPSIPAMTPLELAKEGKHKDVIEYLSSLK